MADPEFPRGCGTNNKMKAKPIGFYGKAILAIFSGNFMKLKENGTISTTPALGSVKSKDILDLSYTNFMLCIDDNAKKEVLI